MPETTGPVVLLREAAEILLDPPVQPPPSWLTETPPNVRESLAAWLELEAKRIKRRHPSDKCPALDLARAICEAVNRG